MPPARSSKEVAQVKESFYGEISAPGFAITTFYENTSKGRDGGGRLGKGRIECEEDGLLLLEAARRGLVPCVETRLVKDVPIKVRPGSCFIYNQDRWGIKRWTDGRRWSPSRINGCFLVYRQCSWKMPHNAAVRKYGVSRGTVHVNGEKVKVGSKGAYRVIQNGLIKSTLSAMMDGCTWHLVTYHQDGNSHYKKLCRPPNVRSLSGIQPLADIRLRARKRSPRRSHVASLRSSVVHEDWDVEEYVIHSEDIQEGNEDDREEPHGESDDEDEDINDDCPCSPVETERSLSSASPSPILAPFAPPLASPDQQEDEMLHLRVFIDDDEPMMDFQDADSYVELLSPTDASDCATPSSPDTLFEFYTHKDAYEMSTVESVTNSAYCCGCCKYVKSDQWQCEECHCASLVEGWDSDDGDEAKSGASQDTGPRDDVELGVETPHLLMIDTSSAALISAPRVDALSPASLFHETFVPWSTDGLAQSPVRSPPHRIPLEPSTMGSIPMANANPTIPAFYSALLTPAQPAFPSVPACDSASLYLGSLGMSNTQQHTAVSNAQNPTMAVVKVEQAGTKWEEVDIKQEEVEQVKAIRLLC
ncbi:hypothetical protein HK104_000417 [Borealophlyctis nickersoniae]|nr:hypothetical protein HK104_000417 [Borealophlyctis nickersoniae]